MRCLRCGRKMVKLVIKKGGSWKRVMFCPNCEVGYEDLGWFLTPWSLVNVRVWNVALSDEEVKKLYIQRSRLNFDGVDDYAKI